MLEVTATTSKPTTVRADALLLGIRTDADADGVAEQLKAIGFTGDEGQTAVFPAGDFGNVKTVVAIGLSEGASTEDLRRAAASGIRAAEGIGAKSVAVALHPAGVDEVGAIAEGLGLGTYRFERYKSGSAKPTSSKSGSTRAGSTTSESGGDDKPRVAKAQILTAFARQSATVEAIDRAAIVAAAVNTARDWVNTAPSDLRPPGFAHEIVELAGKQLEITVWDERRLAREGCGGLLGVGAGSDAPPRLVRLSYQPRKAVSHLALVGKGITFDSGGLSIKPGSSMQTMKQDMSGAAAVVAAIDAIVKLELPIAVTAFACLAENMPSGSAARPGDVFTLRGGQTVEAHNTDAEGRLVLGDGLALAAEASPDQIIDVATLTGACVVALGERTAGLFSNDDELRHRVLHSAENAGEPTWALPIPEEIGASVRQSTIADLRQINTKPAGGALYAAAFLREFVADLPWAHLDIAGPAWNDGKPRDYTPVGGTGAAVRTLIGLAEDLAAGERAQD